MGIPHLMTYLSVSIKKTMIEKQWWYVEKLQIYDRFPQVIEVFITQNPDKYQPRENDAVFEEYYKVTKIIAK